MHGRARFFILLGSNVGQREEYLQGAIAGIGRQIGGVDTISSIYETDAWGKMDQPAFLNQVVSGYSELPAMEIMRIALKIEESLGRKREQKWEPRTIDIDLLFLDDQVVDDSQLKLPHPMLHLRKFTLVPLCEIFPEFRHPILRKSLSSLLADLRDPLEVRVFHSSGS